jgi:hypothetical protein
MILFFLRFGYFLYSLSLKFVTPSVSNMCRKFSCKKTCQVFLKSLCIHFLYFWFFTKIFMHNYIRMWKITTTMKIIIIWIIQYLSLKFIPFRFYIFNIAKIKSLSPMVKKWYLDVNMPSLNSSIDSIKPYSIVAFQISP